ncbi:unnamed protein product, partial [Ectocarpus fasciculatus]
MDADVTPISSSSIHCRTAGDRSGASSTPLLCKAMDTAYHALPLLRNRMGRVRFRCGRVEWIVVFDPELA